MVQFITCCNLLFVGSNDKYYSEEKFSSQMKQTYYIFK